VVKNSSAFFHFDSFGKFRASKTTAILVVFYESHEKNLNIFFLVISALFRPNKQHIDALNSLLLNVEREMGLSQADIQGRQAVAQEVQTLLRPHLPGTNYFKKSINLKNAYGWPTTGRPLVKITSRTIRISGTLKVHNTGADFSLLRAVGFLCSFEFLLGDHE
jgi:hypothetical protein